MSNLELILCRELLESRYKDKLEPRYEEPIHQVVTKIFRGLSGKKVIMPSKDFVRSVILILASLPDPC
jgi:structure-specific recognition protein 1